MPRPIPMETRDWVELVIADNIDDLLRYFRRRVDQPEDASDLLGYVLLALWENGARVPTSDTEARMWCFGIARNILREHHRHTIKRIALADQLRHHLRDLASPDNAADTTVVAQDRGRMIREAVRSLDDRSKELVTLVHWDGFTIAEAARVLRINESTARTRHARALKRLEKSLRDDLEELASLQSDTAAS